MDARITDGLVAVRPDLPRYGAVVACVVAVALVAGVSLLVHWKRTPVQEHDGAPTAVLRAPQDVARPHYRILLVMCWRGLQPVASTELEPAPGYRPSRVCYATDFLDAAEYASLINCAVRAAEYGADGAMHSEFIRDSAIQYGLDVMRPMERPQRVHYVCDLRNGGAT